MDGDTVRAREGEIMAENVLAGLHSSPSRPSALADRPAYKWCVTWTIMLGAFLFALDPTIVNIAIPNQPALWYPWRVAGSGGNGP